MKCVIILFVTMVMCRAGPLLNENPNLDTTTTTTLKPLLPLEELYGKEIISTTTTSTELPPTTELPPKKVRETIPISPPIKGDLALENKEVGGEEKLAVDGAAVSADLKTVQRREVSALEEGTAAASVSEEIVKKDDDLLKPAPAAPTVAEKPKRAAPEIPLDDVKPPKGSTKPDLNRASANLDLLLNTTTGKPTLVVPAELPPPSSPAALKPAADKGAAKVTRDVDEKKKLDEEKKDSLPLTTTKVTRETEEKKNLDDKEGSLPQTKVTRDTEEKKKLDEKKEGSLPSSTTTTTKGTTTAEEKKLDDEKKVHGHPLLSDGKMTRSRRSSYGSSSRVSYAIRQAPAVVRESSEYAAPAVRIEAPARAEYGSRVRSEYQAPAVRSSSYETVREVPIRSSRYETIREAPIRSSSYEKIREVPIRASSYETVREVPVREVVREIVREVPVVRSSYETVREEEIPVRSSSSYEKPIRISMDSYQPSQVREESSSRYRRDADHMMAMGGGGAKILRTVMKSDMKMKFGPGMMAKM